LRSSRLDVLIGEARSPVYEVVHERRVAFVDRDYWVIEDLLEGTRPHHYDLRFHLNAEHASLEGEVVRAPGLQLVVAAASLPRIEAGWVSERYGEKRRAAVVSVPVEGREARFVTLVAAGASRPSLRVRDDEIEVSLDGRVDRLRLTRTCARWRRFESGALTVSEEARP
jgi:hypothetical protein